MIGCFRAVHAAKGRSSGSTPSWKPSRRSTVAQEIQVLPQGGGFYSYGDSAGITPASLFIPTCREPLARQK